MARYFTLRSLALALTASPTLASPAWHHPLYLANQGYWPQRVEVTIQNDSGLPVLGEPVAVAIPGLVGARVESLRVCRADGVELLFDVRDTPDRARRTGPLAAEDRLMLPAEVPAKGTATVFVYAGNDQAWAVPDFLAGGFVNGGFEVGDRSPEGWNPASADALHVVSWEPSGGRNGSRTVKTEVPPGAPPAWVQWQQSAIPVVPGRRYQFSGWVRAEDVSGRAGWFVHVHGEQPMLLNQTLNAGSGTFGWKQISTTFHAPTNARTATIGTVLYGTGRAWHDDAEFKELEGGPGLRVQVGPVEHRRLTRIDAGGPMPADWLSACMAGARNFSDRPIESALIHLDVRPVVARMRGIEPGAAAGVFTRNTNLPAFWLENGRDLLFATSLPARTEAEYRVCFKPGAARAARASNHDYARLLTNRVNLAPHGDFEDATAVSNFWAKTQSGSGITFSVSPDAKFGRHGLEVTIATNARANWIGWRSPEIPVKPGATYLLSGYLKARGLKGTATIHAHWHNAAGKLTATGAFASTHPAVAGDSDWVNSKAFLNAPPDAASITLHLTMNTAGTLRHDGILFAEVLPAHVMRMEAPHPEPEGPPLRVWQVNPLVKVFPDSPPEAEVTRLDVELARNEYEPFQLALRGRRGQAVANVAVSVSMLRNDAGATLPPVKIERVGFVPIDHPTAYYRADVPEWCRKVPHGAGRTDGWAGWWPDPLLPAREFAIGQDRTEPVWFTVRAPRDSAPGVYRGAVTIQAAGQIRRTVPLTVTVLPFALPETTRLKVLFDFRRGRGGWFGPDLKSPEQYRKWLRFIAEHRLGIDQIEPAPKFTYQDGKVTMDTAGFDETARFCFEELGMTVSYTPWFFYMFGWAYPPKKLFGLEPFTPEWTAVFKQAYKLFSDHVRAKGWHHRFVYYISDEPHFHHEFVVRQMQQLCALIHEVNPRMPIYSSTWRHCAAWDESLDLWGVAQYGGFPVAEMERLQKAGKQMWFTCDGQMATDTPFLATERLLPYYCFKYGVQGYEFWGLTWWTYDPWQLGWHQFIRQSDDGKRHYWVRYPNGDGYLAYPGQAVGVDGPVSTIRLEQVREGLEDYEAMAMLAEAITKAKQAGRSVAAGETALTQAKELVSIPNAGGLRSTEILPNPDRVPDIRRGINAALVEMMR